MIAPLEVFDAFCGAGGTSEGLRLASLDLEFRYQLGALNHWDVAIATHEANHPEARHFRDDIYKMRMQELVPGGRLDLLRRRHEEELTMRKTTKAPAETPAAAVLAVASQRLGPRGIETVLDLEPGEGADLIRGKTKPTDDQLDQLRQELRLDGYAPPDGAPEAGPADERARLRADAAALDAMRGTEGWKVLMRAWAGERQRLEHDAAYAEDHREAVRARAELRTVVRLIELVSGPADALAQLARENPLFEGGP